MTTPERLLKLKKNFAKMFWLKALLYINLFGIVSTLFYLDRGLTLKQIFYTAILFAVVNFFMEIPSSYMADNWGRKKVIILSCLCHVLYWIIMFFSYSFPLFLFAFIFIAISYAFMSGTDEALIYDSNKELGEEHFSLKKLGQLFSADTLFRIIIPFIAAVIAKDLLPWQFQTILVIQILTSTVALVIACFLTEANHTIDVQKQEVGIMKDAFKIIRRNKEMVRAIFNKTLFFISSFIIWRYHQKFFIDIDISLLILGVGTCIIGGVIFFSNQNISKFFPKRNINFRINILNIIYLSAILLFILCFLFFFNKYLLLFFYIIQAITTTVREPLFSEFFNKEIHSFNRATTLSLVNFFNSIFQIPLLFIAAMLIDKNVISPYILVLFLGLGTHLLFKMKPTQSLAIN